MHNTSKHEEKTTCSNLDYAALQQSKSNTDLTSKEAKHKYGQSLQLQKQESGFSEIVSPTEHDISLHKSTTYSYYRS